MEPVKAPGEPVLVCGTLVLRREIRHSLLWSPAAVTGLNEAEDPAVGLL